jgi:hypothetical protein
MIGRGHRNSYQHNPRDPQRLDGRNDPNDKTLRSCIMRFASTGGKIECSG